MDAALQYDRHDTHQAHVTEGAVPWAYRFFGAALLGRDPNHLPLGVRAIVRWAVSESRRMTASGRTNPDRELTLGLRLAYGALKAEAAALRGPAPDDPPRAPILQAVSRLRHRQRAAVLLRFGLGLDEEDVAQVLGIRPAQARAVVACATTGIARSAKRPVDVARAMRAAAKDRSQPRRVVRSDASATIETLPRGVMRTLLAPPEALPETLPAIPPEAQHACAGPVEALITPRCDPVVGTLNVAPRKARAWSLLGRLAAAASIGVLFAWSVWPAYG